VLAVKKTTLDRSARLQKNFATKKKGRFRSAPRAPTIAISIMLAAQKHASGDFSPAPHLISSSGPLSSTSLWAWTPCSYENAVGKVVYQYFGGKLIKNATGYVGQDRLGSIGKFFPYGQERPSTTTNGKEKFATYFRDSETGLDYAQNRYHSVGDGRFLSPDPYQPSAGPSDPGSWNRYAYVEGDPINFTDHSGLKQDHVEDYCDVFGSVDPKACDPLYCLTNPTLCANDPGATDPNRRPSCDQFRNQMQWTDEQFKDASIIQQDASRLGLELGGFKIAAGEDGMHIGSGPFSNTEYTLTGGSSALGLLLGNMCHDANDSTCFTEDTTNDILHPGIEFNFRQNSAKDSMQITGKWDSKSNVWIVQLDIDPNNPLKNFRAHSADVLKHMITGRDTDYGEVAGRLGIDAMGDNPWCRP
jgi:RHS repeat-associated protein